MLCESHLPIAFQEMPEIGNINLIYFSEENVCACPGAQGFNNALVLSSFRKEK